MTISEKILAVHAGRDAVSPGEFVLARVDFALANDITAPVSIRVFEDAGAKKVFDPERIALIADHFTPCKDVQTAAQVDLIRRFANKHGIRHFYEVGAGGGVEHAFLPEQGLVLPGDLVIGADSHTCTYGALGAFATGVGSTDLAAAMATGKAWFRVPETLRVVFTGRPGEWVCGKDLILTLIGKIGVEGANYMAIEFTGGTISHLNIADRFTMANMAIEAGAKAGIFIPDDVVRDYVAGRAKRKYEFHVSDADAPVARTFEINAASVEPVVALPHLPSNVKPARDVKDLTIQQVVIGSCTNGRIEDLRIAARVLKGRRVAKGVRALLLPATEEVYRSALKEGLIAIFSDAGVTVGPPTCGPCLGGHMGVLAEGERAVSTTNRNFVGRMGHPKSEVVLAGPAVAAASAILGRVADPRDVVGEG